MTIKDIVAKEVARQAGFGYEPSWEDFVIAGQQAGIREVVECVESLKVFLDLDYIEVPTRYWQSKLKEWGIK